MSDTKKHAKVLGILGAESLNKVTEIDGKAATGIFMINAAQLDTLETALSEAEEVDAELITATEKLSAAEANVTTLTGQLATANEKIEAHDAGAQSAADAGRKFFGTSVKTGNDKSLKEQEQVTADDQLSFNQMADAKGLGKKK